jgi:Carboxypeptidase regulatory-like domain
MSRWPWGKCVTVLVALLALGPSGVFAQSTASISGVVKDIGGAVLPGVSVAVKNDASGTAQEVLTDATGRYQSALSMPGPTR